MPVVANSDGTLWIDIEQISEVDAVSRRLHELGVPVAARVPDPECDIAVEEVDWGGELRGSSPVRNGPEPGVIVDPAQIPEGHTLLLENQLMPGPRRGHAPGSLRA